MSGDVDKLEQSPESKDLPGHDTGHQTTPNSESSLTHTQAQFRESWGFRLLSAFVCIGLLVVALLRLPHRLSRLDRRPASHDGPPEYEWPTYDISPWPCSDIPGIHNPRTFTSFPSVNISRDTPQLIHYTFILPLDKEEMIFYARGSYAYGTFEISQTGLAMDAGPNYITTDVDVSFITIDVDVSYTRPDAPPFKLCKPSPESFGNRHGGVGIFTPITHDVDFEPSIHVNINVRLPIPCYEKTRKLGTLKTYLPLFEHRLPDLTGSVQFNEIQLLSSNSSIDAGSLEARAIWIQNSYGAIEGSFKIAHSLDLATNDAPINISASLPTVHELSITDNIYVDASAATDVRKSTLRFTALTSNAPVTLAFTDTASVASLHAIVEARNASVQMALPHTYEGGFYLNSPGSVEPPSVVCVGQKRVLSMETFDETRVVGSIANSVEGLQDARAGKEGFVGVLTTRGKVQLLL